MPPSLIPVLTPHGALRLEARDDEAPLDDAVAARLAAYFSRGDGHGLLHLGLAEAGTDLPPGLAFWRGFAMRFVRHALPVARGGERAAVCGRAIGAGRRRAADAGRRISDRANPRGGCGGGWRRRFALELAESGVSLRDFMAGADRRWRLVGRVHLNLAENRRDPDFPFAFMATYAASLGEQGGLRHAPLAQALRDYADDKRKLLELLEPVSHAAERLRLAEGDRRRRRDFPSAALDAQGRRCASSRRRDAWRRRALIVRMPASWRMNRPSRPEVEATVGSDAPSRVGAEQMLDFDMRVTLDGETLTREEIESLLDVDRRPRPAARKMGRDRPRAAEGDARALRGGGAARRAARG